jgi:hypothetical protein
MNEVFALNLSGGIPLMPHVELESYISLGAYLEFHTLFREGCRSSPLVLPFTIKANTEAASFRPSKDTMKPEVAINSQIK